MENQNENWKEWISLQPLIDKIPQQFQHRLVVDPLILTCVDAYPDHLVLGTNIGLIYLVHLPSYNIIKLKCENAFLYVTSIAAVSSVDDMIAAGCSKGSITIFQVPLVTPSKLTSSQDCSGHINKSEVKCPKRFTLRVHQRIITSLVWSKNSMKLFSGDEEGNVYIIEIDYEKSECTGKLLLQVDSKIVQLSYAHQKLAVSYLERCLIYNFRDERKVLVGKKPRNPPGMFGCVFSSSLENPQEDILYCARPNRKIWSANSEGEVLFSYIHQKIPESSKVKLKDSSKVSPVNNKVEFGSLYDYKRSVLVSHTENCLIIVNVNSQKVLAFCSNVQKICDIAVSGNNVFLLDNHRKLICLSPYEPSFGQERTTTNTSYKKNSLTGSVHIPLQENLNFDSFYDIKAKIPEFLDINLLGNISKFGETVASKLSEIAAPNIVSGNKDEEEDGIGNTNGDTPLMSSSTRMPRPYFIGLGAGAAIQSLEKSNTEEKVCEEKSPCVENLDSKTEPSKNQREIDEKKNSSVVVLPKEKKKVKKKLAIDKPHDVQPIREFNSDSRTYEDFKETIEENERVLAEVLNLSCLKKDHEKNFNDDIEISEYYESENSSSNFVSCLPRTNQISSDSIIDIPHYTLPSLSNTGKELSYGPPSGSSAIHSSLDDNALLSCGAFPFKGETFGSELNSEDVNTMPPAEEVSWDWYRHHLPAKPETFIGYKSSICLTESKALYFSHDFYLDNQKLPTYKRRKLKELIRCFSCCGKELFVLTSQGSVFSVDSEKLTEPKSILFQDKNVASISFDEEKLWTITKNGKIFCRNLGDSNSTVEISCLELNIKKVVCRSGVVWALTHNGRIAYRIGVRPNVPFGLEWGIMLHPYKVKCIHLSENGLGWMLDEKANLFVRLHIRQTYPQGVDGKWWQVGISDYMFGNGVCDDMMGMCSVTEEINFDKILMASNENFLWLSQADSPFAFAHSLRSFVGHRWDRLSDEKFTCICGEGIFKSYGTLYCLDSNVQLFAVNPHSDSVLPIESPNNEKLISISSRPESLWALTESGKIFIRTGLSGTSVLGLNWVQLDLYQIADVKLHHVSLSTEVVWAVDVDGQIYIRQGPLTPSNPKKKGLDPAWLQVDDVDMKNTTFFKKVYVGNKSHMVWAVDSNFRVYVRQAIFPEVSTGTSWVLVSGIRAQSLSISEDLVYAVTPILGNDGGGVLYVREGITLTNYIGESWKRIPIHSFKFQDITASVDNCIWGLERDGTILRLSKLHLFDVDSDGKLPPSVGDEEGVFSPNDLKDWEII